MSTAYYALFNLLIDEAVGNWGVARHRSTLARLFDHGKMKNVCELHVKNVFSGGKPASGLRLKNVALTFTLLQQQRHEADYNNSIVWQSTDTIDVLDMVSAAFSDWRAIRKQDATQDFLLELFLSRMPGEVRR